MVGFTRLLCGTATVAEAMRQEAAGRVEPGLLRFSTASPPLVVWSITHRCNLRCPHCYLDAPARGHQEELTSEEALALVNDLAALRVPAVIFSGGEPLLRKDVLGLARYATEKGIRPVLSTNGTLITHELAARIRAAGVQYVGVSLDGLEATHDRFRAKPGAFRDAVAGIEACSAAGVKAGIRFTLNAENLADLSGVLDLAEGLRVPRFCLYHLVYAGSGARLKDHDVTPAQRRLAMDLLIGRVLAWARRRVPIEVLTTCQHADGAFLQAYLAERAPEPTEGRAAEARRLLQRHGGCSAGCKVANVDPLGSVHACRFWRHAALGNVRERKFADIWRDPANPLLCQLRGKLDHLKGKCATCAHKAICGGCRLRAEAVYGDPWAEDPACYLTEHERGQPWVPECNPGSEARAHHGSSLCEMGC
ncbi:MAG: radical SAM protein [Planctomycetes bacterium]|nr:radical SAM protein [Planctomycetota bacterium]